MFAGLLSVAIAHAQTAGPLVVCPEGTDEPFCAQVGLPSSLEAVPEGAEILFHPGTYEGRLVVDRPVRLAPLGRGGVRWGGGVDAGAASAVLIDVGQTLGVEVEGFVLEGASNAALVSGGELVLRDVLVRDHEGGSAALHLKGGRLELSDSTMTGNSGGWAGHVRGEAGELVVDGSVFLAGSGAWSSAVVSDYTLVSIERSWFRDAIHAAAVVDALGGELVLARSWLEGNRIDAGWAVQVWGCDEVRLEQIVVDGQGQPGGGVRLEANWTASLTDSWLCNGTSPSEGGALSMHFGCPYGCTVAGNVFRANAVDGLESYGGGIFARLVADVAISGNTFADHAVDKGSALYATQSWVSFAENLFEAPSTTVGGVYEPADLNGSLFTEIRDNGWWGDGDGFVVNEVVGASNTAVATDIVLVEDELVHPCGDPNVTPNHEIAWNGVLVPGAHGDTCGPLCTDADLDGYPAVNDCDDDDPAVHPDARDEPGDGVDQDCDGLDRCYSDGDGDGFAPAGAAEIDGLTPHCTGPGEASAPVEGAIDCDDADIHAFPGHPEVEGDGSDNDCDGRLDETPDDDGTTAPDVEQELPVPRSWLAGTGGCRHVPAPLAWSLPALLLLLVRRRQEG